MSIKEAEPGRLWTYFEEICKIPRLPGKEDRIIRYLTDFALKHNLFHQKDETGNILIRKPASPGYGNMKTLILQSHLDMVGEKEAGNDHDFDKDPIEPFIEKGWIRAKGTTLGADDGIGIAAQLVILEGHGIEHGPLECLFTVDEESGMTGAKKIGEGFLTGKILINLDSEDEGEMFIGCAGGIDTVATFPFSPKKVNRNCVFYYLTINGLRGGHSGDEIHKSPANAIKILNRFLWNICSVFKVRIIRYEGGNLRNAIPRKATAHFCVPSRHTADFESFYQIFAATVKKELRFFEPDLNLDLLITEASDSIINRKTQNRLLDAIYACPHGVIAWSGELENLVETSTNLASVRQLNNERKIRIVTSQRSSVDSSKKDISDRISCIFRLAGAEIEHTDGYPGWSPNANSEILRIASASYKRLFRRNPVVSAIHAGLECGLILEKYPGLDMISFGPTIKGAHTTSERINIRSTEKFWRLLLDVLKNIPRDQ